MTADTSHVFALGVEQYTKLIIRFVAQIRIVVSAQPFSLSVPYRRRRRYYISFKNKQKTINAKLQTQRSVKVLGVETVLRYVQIPELNCFQVLSRASAHAEFQSEGNEMQHTVY